MSAPKNGSQNPAPPGSWPSASFPSCDTTTASRDEPSAPLPRHTSASAQTPALTASKSGKQSITECYPYQPPTGQKCRVFISHAGEQKRELVDIVREKLEQEYPALRREVFVDESSLEGGFEAMDNVYTSLQDAFVVVLVLSREFISKRYPMEELQLLLHWQDAARKAGTPAAKLLPVFYHLSCEEMDAQAALYSTAAAGQLTAQEKQRKRQWAEDLKKLGGVTGLRKDQVACGWGTAMRDKVVEDTVRLLCELGQMPTFGTVEEPGIKVGLDAKVDQVVQLLKAEGSNSMVLLHGMGGIGKTTLARVVFNQLLREKPNLPHCFLSLDPEMKQGELRDKQRQLLRELAHVKDASMPETVDEGQQKLAQNLKGKVLLVLDNVWKQQRVSRLLQHDTLLELLDKGSMVLVTSREDTAADQLLGRAGRSRVSRLAVECLSTQESLELFCQYAYDDGRSSPPADERQLVLTALARCGYLPMAVEVIGRYYAELDDTNRFFDDFRDTMAYAFRKQEAGMAEGDATLFGVLRLSWNRLNIEEQAALLDIAFMPNGQPWDWVEHHCGPFVLHSLCALGLVKQQERQGACRGGSQQLAFVHDTVSFFCSDEDAIGRPPQHKALKWDDPSLGELQQESPGVSLKGVSRRFAPVDVGELVGLTDLRVLRLTWCTLTWGGCLATFLRTWALQNTLELSLSNLRWLQLKDAESLRSLVLQGMRSLRVLCLEDCDQLRGVELRSCPGLRAVQVSDCERLKTLDVGGAKSLRQLRILVCEKLMWLGGLEHLSELTSLELGGSERLKQLDVGGLWALKELGIVDCSQVRRVDGVRDLGALQRFQVEGCKRLKQLDVGGLWALKELEVVDCSQVRCVSGLRDLGALRSVKVEGCGQLKQLDVGGLRALEELKIRRCTKVQCVDGLCGLGALRSVRVDGCEQLKTLNVGGLGGLEELEIRNCKKVQGVDGMKDLGALRSMKLGGCDQLKQLDVGGLGGLEELKLRDCKKVQRVAGMRNLSALRSIKVDDCEKLEVLDLGALRALEELKIRWCGKLQGVHAELRELRALTLLELDGQSVRAVLDLRALTALQELRLWACAKMKGVVGLGGLRALRLWEVDPTDGDCSGSSDSSDDSGGSSDKSDDDNYRDDSDDGDLPDSDGSDDDALSICASRNTRNTARMDESDTSSLCDSDSDSEAAGMHVPVVRQPAMRGSGSLIAHLKAQGIECS